MSTSVLSNLVITDIYSANTLFSTKGNGAKRQNRPGWALVLKFEGETIYTQEDCRYVSDRANVILLPRGCSYEWTCTRTGHFFIIEFQCNAVYDSVFSFSVKDCSRLLSACREMEQRRLMKKSTSLAESIRDTYSILLMLAEESHKKYLPNEKRERLRPAMEYISAHYTDAVTNDGLAALCGVSTVYFRKLFAQVYGTSPISYIQDLRIQKAKEMLTTDFGNVGDIAHALGYKSIYDFSRTFKKHTSLSPSRYRAQRSEKKIL